MMRQKRAVGAQKEGLSRKTSENVDFSKTAKSDF